MLRSEVERISEESLFKDVKQLRRKAVQRVREEEEEEDGNIGQALAAEP